MKMLEEELNIQKQQFRCKETMYLEQIHFCEEEINFLNKQHQQDV